jgi:hypothetical protein
VRDELREAIRLPRDGEPRPDHLVSVATIDTGGAWRPAHRSQFGDPNETHADHESANCTMSSAATAFAYEDHYAGATRAPWGGDLRHHQDDLEGGTDLNDAKVAWSRYGGRTLTIRSGDGWSGVDAAHREGRAIVIQGEGDCPGSGTFAGGHACCIGPESSGGNWLWSDPCTTGWQWVSASSIRTWAERLSSGVCFAVSRAGGAGGGDIPMDVDVIDAGPKVCDVAEGVQLYQLDGATPALRMPQDRNGMAVLFSTSSPGGTTMRVVRYTKPDPDPDLALAVYNADARNLRPDPAYAAGGGGEDPESVRRERDAEWVDALTTEWPVQVDIT